MEKVIVDETEGKKLVEENEQKLEKTKKKVSKEKKRKHDNRV